MIFVTLDLVNNGAKISMKIGLALASWPLIIVAFFQSMEALAEAKVGGTKILVEIHCSSNLWVEGRGVPL